MTTSNDKHHWVLHLAPTASDGAKLDEYFGKLQNSEIEALQMQGDFGEKFGGLGSGGIQKSKINEQN